MAQSVSPLVFNLSTDLASVDGSQSQIADMDDWRSSAFTADLSRRDYHLAAEVPPGPITIGAASGRTHTAWRSGCRAIAGELHGQSGLADGYQAGHNAAADAADAAAAQAEAEAAAAEADGNAAAAEAAREIAEAAWAEAAWQRKLARLAGIWSDDADDAAAQGDDLTARYDRLFGSLNAAVAAAAGDRAEAKTYGVL